MRARMHQRSGRGACNAAGRPLVHALPCCLLAAPAASWGEIGYSTVLRVGPHLEIPTRVPYSASRAAGEPPAPGAKVFTENVRHLGSFIEKRPLLSGACVSLTWKSIESVSFASSDFKLRIRAQLFLAGMGYF
jgi:hypothetical protein